MDREGREPWRRSATQPVKPLVVVSMKITEIHIDGFGVWHDRRWRRLSEGVNVFHGPNETGKTTLMSFVRSILFGFERRSHPRRYEPLGGGSYGGALEVLHDGQAIRIERKAGRHVRGSVRLHYDGAIRADADDDERALEGLLGGTTRTLYHNVFAFGLEELEHFRTLQESEVASHISGAGMGVGATRWSRVWKDLEERRSRLFLPRGQNSTINRALKELESVRDELDRTESDPEDYVTASEQRLRLDHEIRSLEQTAGRLQKRMTHYEKLKEAEPYRARRIAIQAELRRIDRVDRFPEGGVERLNLLLHQRRQMDQEMDDQQAEVEKIRAERLELASRYPPQELLRRSRSAESLHSLLPRRDAVDEIVAGARAKKDAVSNERTRIRSHRDALRPPSRLATAIFMGVVAIGAAGLFLADQRIASAGVAVTLAVIGSWYYRRERRSRELDRDLAACGKRLQSAEEDLARLERDGGKIVATIEKLVGRSDFSFVDLERENAKIQELTEMADRIRSIDEGLVGEERHRRLIRKQIAENGRGIESLFKEADAASENDFFHRAELFQQRQQLRDELARTPSGEVVVDPEVGAELAGIEPSDAETYGKELARFKQVEERLLEARTEAGRLEERISALGRSEERSRARLHQESILARIDEASEKWAVLTLCRTLLDETRRIYETERQPEVLRHASEFFAGMSDGRWARVVAGLDSADIFLESSDGRRVSPENLSRGTGEQLYLAMRLALVREYSRHVEPLPVVFDDIFVNFDPDRTRRSVEAVRELSRTHQILLFTCHPHLLELIEEIVPSAEIYPLQ